MAELLELSAQVIDTGKVDGPVVRVTEELSQLSPQLAFVESFSNSVAMRTADGLVVFDASSAATGGRVVRALRGWSTDPVEVVVYTHGHLDHVGGSPAFLEDAKARGRPRPRFVAHERVPARLARYRRTAGWNARINARQFGWMEPHGLGTAARGGMAAFEAALERVAGPDEVYASERTFEVGGLEVRLRHGLGETDDHTWAYVPAFRAVVAGDFFIWNFPNAGNPQKVQRYPEEWAQTLRSMAALEPELFLPAHGLPIGGPARIRRVLDEVATALESLVEQVLSAMNAGATLDEVVHTVALPPELLERPYLRPLYDEPEFVVRNVYRLYGGWWDGNPAHLHPPAERALALEVAALAGGARTLARRAEDLADAGDLRLACQLAEWAAGADPEDPEVRRVRSELYERRRHEATSLMAKGIYAAAARNAVPLRS